jgi:hypothetical protein
MAGVDDDEGAIGRPKNIWQIGGCASVLAKIDREPAGLVTARIIFRRSEGRRKVQQYG